jgi:nucleoside 2-deoxyribosyltransferase
MAPADKRKRVYLAGPDVFRADAAEQGERLKARCGHHGFEGVFPLDAVVPTALSKIEQAAWIYRENTRLIRACDGMAANLTPFRGISVDPGTAFEIGYAASRGLPIAGYSDVSDSYLARVRRRFAVTISGESFRDQDGNVVEDFDLEDNLMIMLPLAKGTSGRRIGTTIDDALDALRAHFLSAGNAKNR